ncbi:sodium:proton antiporter [Virgibacillus halodenitrificans]|uniref:cation:proton antiporter n=1 Tax=Virgibacillus halodenitrificans TaxID=1482 RepID=UPI00045C3591|nr:sodium:proton antiporter [Virgibacillus halodenitrificans]MCG1029401.1 sodium:proton antiporter [Virgibacillus halodenitrificans]MCJ0931423.1 sodium:proton antiporter [Virgibacillus halodenitrificans]CDQ36063.1 Sodium, potassium, lithium and rubidium/H(+) antiporter [Virgibacillus halodenitrificans]
MITHQILLLLLAGYIVFSIDKKQNYFPVPVVLVVLGIFLSFVPIFQGITITKEIIFNVFLPALLFISSYSFSVQALKKNKWLIGGMGTVGLMFTVAILGLSIYAVGNLFINLSLIGSLLIAGILSPTDPVSVVSILKNSTSDEKVADVVEGESLLNDGTSIVVFTVLLEMYLHDQSFSVTSFITEFLFVSLGGVFIGIIFGWLLSKAIHYTNHRQYQVMLSIIIAYGSFYLGELLGVSGVLATVTSGLLLSYEFGKHRQEEQFRDSLDGFWTIVEPTILSIIFLLIGIQSANYLFDVSWALVVIIFILSLVSRFIVLATSTMVIPRWRQRFTLGDSGMITWAGIKGTMSVALLLGLEAEASNAHLLVSLTFSVIVLSLIIQSIGVYPLTRRLSKEH